MIGYMEMYVAKDGFLDVDQLPDTIRALYDERQASDAPLWVWRRKLKDTLAPEKA